VLKRSVEDAILGFLLRHALAKGASRVRGLYRPSRKNGQVSGFYSAHGFEESARHADGTVVFERPTTDPVDVPDCIRISGPD
jgi:predicted enzyme involved in methoxymalonyl-ACP biosynthesis